jgi:ABC-2 type transport system permease protein
MLWHIAWFEIRFWLRSWMLWIFLFVVALPIFGAISSDEVMAELNLSNIYRNAPFAIASFYAAMGVFALLMTAVFVNFAALRDFSCNTFQMMFSTPIRRRDFLFGRFLGATLVSAIPMLGVSLGILLAKYMPWSDRERWGAVSWTAHLKGILLFALPDTFFTAAILLAAAVVWRRDIASFVAAILLLAGRAVTLSLTQGPQWDRIRSLFDPYAVNTFLVATKYWTVADKNLLSLSFTGLLLWNRLLWLGVGCAAFALAYSRFSFAERRTKTKALEPGAQPAMAPAVTPEPDLQLKDSPWAKFLGSFRIHFSGMAKNTAFVVVVMIASMICTLALTLQATQFQGNQTVRIFPVTYWVIELIRGTLDFLLIVIITYFSGALVWKDRDERMDEIADATPTPEWVSYAARLVTLIAMVMLIQAVALVAGIVVQAAHGYYRFQFGLYAHELLVRDASWFVLMAILAFFVHALAPNKYVGYFVFIAFYSVNSFLWKPLNVATNLVQFAGRPNVVYSDFFGDAPYRSAWDWFTFYWLLFSVLVAIATVMFWPRGKQERWQARSRKAALRFGSGWKTATAVSLLAFAVCGGWIWYNTEILNRLLDPKDVKRVQADYEKTYKPLDKLPQPRVRSVKYAIDVFPLTRNATVRGDEVIYNPYSHPLDEIHFSLNPLYDTSIEIPGAMLAQDDTRLSYRIYRFTSPLQPGEERTLLFTVKSKNRGFENDVSNTDIVQNGTFFNSGPIIGYNYFRQLSDAVERKKFGLPEFDLMSALERNCTTDCSNSYIPG